MNKIIPTYIEYLSPSRTIEILNLVRFEESKQVYVYNFEGKHFRFFDSLVDLIRFFESGKEPQVTFESEIDLDDFLDRLPVGDGKRKLNLKLNYRYRDASNYKQFGSVVFSNPDYLTPRIAEKTLIEKLISSEFFIPQKWGLQKLHHHTYDPEIDHKYHEFECFEWTEEKVTDERRIDEFLSKIETHE